MNKGRRDSRTTLKSSMVKTVASSRRTLINTTDKIKIPTNTADIANAGLNTRQIKIPISAKPAILTIIKEY
ncbi:MAG: hypothetical protein FI698_06860 [SAR202 cluster bacterium]|nr:hypothetical protein [SAR202 cluster bacterium]